MKLKSSLSLILLIFNLTFIFDSGEAGKILFYTPFAAKSYKITFTPILEELSKRGHEVTAVMPFDEKTDKYQVICTDPDGSIMKEVAVMFGAVLQKGIDLSMMSQMTNFATKCNQNALKHPQMQKWILDPTTKFDLVIVQPFLAGEAGYYLGYRFQAPTATYLTTQSQLPYISSSVGQPFNPSYTPIPVVPFAFGEMNFFQRAINTFASFMVEHVMKNILLTKMVDSILDDNFPGETRPDLLELEQNVSAVFQFGHPFILDGWTPMVPNFVQLGMMNCRAGKSFPSNEQVGKFLENSRKGVVLLSFGSLIKSEDMTVETKEIFHNVFHKFSDYDFIWKFDGDKTNIPKNVLVSNWLPQQDILAHQNLKVFITHAGQSSFQESLCHQKPVLALPISGDQPINALEAEKIGIGINLPYKDITEEKLVKALDEVLHNPKYTQTAQKFGSLLNDQITKPLDRAIWWIEHIMRHPDMYAGKSPVHKLSWYQYFLLDVLAFGLAILFILFSILKFVFKKCCRINKSKKD